MFLRQQKESVDGGVKKYFVIKNTITLETAPWAWVPFKNTTLTFKAIIKEFVIPNKRQFKSETLLCMHWRPV